MPPALGSSYWTGAIDSGVGLDGEGADGAALALTLSPGETPGAGAGWAPLPLMPNANNPINAPDIIASTSVITNDLFSFMRIPWQIDIDRRQFSRATMKKSAMCAPRWDSAVTSLSHDPCRAAAWLPI